MTPQELADSSPVFLPWKRASLRPVAIRYKNRQQEPIFLANILDLVKLGQNGRDVLRYSLANLGPTRAFFLNKESAETGVLPDSSGVLTMNLAGDEV